MASGTGNARAAGRSGGKSAGPANRPAGKGTGRSTGKKGSTRLRTPVAPIRSGPPWGLIAIGVAIALFATVVIGYAVHQGNVAKKTPAERINGVVNYRNNEKLARNHVSTAVKYAQSPPVGGNHNPVWENCMGDVYPAAIANEHAVHSMEHGAVWVTYNPSLPKSQVAALTADVRGKTYVLMSPYPGLTSPISLQAWGYQLKVKQASDKRIKQFISTLSQTASVEPGAACAGGTSKTGPGL